MSSYLAQKAAGNMVGSALADLDAPLLGENGDENEAGLNDGEPAKRKPTKMDGLIGSVLLGTSGSYATAMVLFGSIVTTVAGSISIGTCAFTGYQRTQIVDTRSLRDFINLIRDQVGRFALENEKLGANVDELENQTGRLKGFESAMNDIAEKNGKSVDELVGLVKENGEIIAEMKDIVKGDVAQTLIRTVVAGDVDGDFHISQREVEILILRLLQMPGVTMHEDKFRIMIKKHDGSMDAIMQVVLGMFDEKIEEKDKIFEIDEPTPENLQTRMY